MGAGIDYGRGITNVDFETRIRYGVISQHSILQAWADSAEGVYPDPTCPECSGDVKKDESEDGDYWCETCEHHWDEDQCVNEDAEAIGWRYKEDGYVAVDCLDNDVMVIKSPFYTFAKFCSPCVPGAGNLNSHDMDGVKTYCFGHDWFYDAEGERAPYRVFRVADDVELVIEHVEKECPTCRGRGELVRTITTHEDQPLRCWRCHGKGKITEKVEKEVR